MLNSLRSCWRSRSRRVASVLLVIVFWVAWPQPEFGSSVRDGSHRPILTHQISVNHGVTSTIRHCMLNCDVWSCCQNWPRYGIVCDGISGNFRKVLTPAMTEFRISILRISDQQDHFLQKVREFRKLWRANFHLLRTTSFDK